MFWFSQQPAAAQSTTVHKSEADPGAVDEVQYWANDDGAAVPTHDFIPNPVRADSTPIETNHQFFEGYDPWTDTKNLDPTTMDKPVSPSQKMAITSMVQAPYEYLHRYGFMEPISPYVMSGEVTFASPDPVPVTQIKESIKTPTAGGNVGTPPHVFAATSPEYY